MHAIDFNAIAKEIIRLAKSLNIVLLTIRPGKVDSISARLY